MSVRDKVWKSVGGRSGNELLRIPPNIVYFTVSIRYIQNG